MKQQTFTAALFKSAGFSLIFLVSQTIAAFLSEVVILLCLSSGTSLSLMDALERYQDVYFSLIYEIMLLSAVIFMGLLVLVSRRSFSPLSGMKKTPGTSVLAGIFLGFAAYPLVSVLIQVANLIPAVQASQEAYLKQHQAIASASPSLWAEVLYGCLIGPFVEEILCRGFILNTLKKSARPATAIGLSALVFAVIHGNLYQIVFTLPLGLLLGYLAYRSGSVWPAVGLHMAFNSSNYLMQLGTYLGFEEGGEMWTAVTWSVLLFCLFSLPVGVLLWRHTQKDMTPLFEKRARPDPDFYDIYTTPSPVPSMAGEREGETMAAPEFMIVGLGNPGEKYASNRHNCGFMALDYLALRLDTPIRSLRFQSLCSEAMIDGKKVLLLKPQTFMNSSGQAVREAASFYHIPPEKILVIFDDISFDPGVFRIRKSGSAGGHNGIKSIIAHLSSDAFPRVKMGVGAPPPGWELMHWVLGNPSKEDQDKIIATLEDVYATVRSHVAGDLDGASARFNGKVHG